MKTTAKPAHVSRYLEMERDRVGQPHSVRSLSEKEISDKVKELGRQASRESYQQKTKK